ncbi:MAG: hypothetical protein GY791_05345 [Alphaproteobacteria bacterium]|nr:hypothetical protein [Alphaproteobacteria bacterium]
MLPSSPVPSAAQADSIKAIAITSADMPATEMALRILASATTNDVRSIILVLSLSCGVGFIGWPFLPPWRVVNATLHTGFTERVPTVSGGSGLIGARLAPTDEESHAVATDRFRMRHADGDRIPIAGPAGRRAVLGLERYIAGEDQERAIAVVAMDVVEFVRYPFDRIGGAVALLRQHFPERRFVHRWTLRLSESYAAYS